MRLMPIASVVSLVCAGALAAACGSAASSPTQNTTPDASIEAGEVPADDTEAGVDAAAPYPALTPTDLPQVIDLGGAVLDAPKVVPIFFQGDDSAIVSSLTDFVKRVGKTDYWKTVVGEYGVGAATATDAVNLTEVAPNKIDDSDIQAWLIAKLNANDPAFPAPDANTIYTIFYPAGTTITLGGTPASPDGGAPDGGSEAGAEDAGAHDAASTPGGNVQTSCSSFGGYHQNVQLDAAHGNAQVAYAVLPRCAKFGTLTGVDAVTGAASHELMEAATDPFPLAQAAYAQVDDAHVFWELFLGGGEIGDMCAQSMSSFVKFPELPEYTVQRGWSNKAARAGHAPCVPVVAGEPYFNAAPVFNDTVAYSIGGQSVSVRGVKIPAGQSATVELDLFSDGPTSAPWSLSAMDGAQLRGQSPQLKFDFDKPTGVNGDKVGMKITVVTASKRNRETFVVLSKLGGATNMWIGVVGN